MFPFGSLIRSHLDLITTSTFVRLVGAKENSIAFAKFGSRLDPMAILMVSGTAKKTNGFAGSFALLIIVGIAIAIGIEIGRKVSLPESPFQRKVSFSESRSPDKPANSFGPCPPLNNIKFKSKNVIKKEPDSSLLASNRSLSSTGCYRIKLELARIWLILFIINNILMQHKIWHLHPNTDWRSESYIPSGTQKPSDHHTHANRTRFPGVTCDVANLCYDIEERDSYLSSITSLPSSFSYEVIQHWLLITADKRMEEEKCLDQYMSNQQVKRGCLSTVSSNYLSTVSINNLK